MRPTASPVRKTHERRRALAGAVELGFWIVGSIALAIWTAAQGHARFESQRDLERFEQAVAAEQSRPPTATSPEEIAFEPAPVAAQAAPAATPLPAPGAPDRRLWSPTRLEGFARAERTRRPPPLAVLEIDAIDLRVAVHDGVDALALNRGVGRIPQTAAPGDAGNLGIAGHRDGFFRELGALEAGDELVLHTLRGPERYRVRWTRVVEPEDVDVLAPTARPSLTLVTCFPFRHVGSAPQRFIVRAERIDGEPRA